MKLSVVPRAVLGGALLSVILLAGCQSPEVAMVSTEPKAGSVVLRPSLREGSHVQARVVPYKASDIRRLMVIPHEQVSPGVFWPLAPATGQATDSTDISQIYHLLWEGSAFDPQKPIVLTNLKRNTTYRIVARAENEALVGISNDASSSVDVTVGTDDRPTMGTLPIQLKDVSFLGTAEVQLVRTGTKDYDHLDLLLEKKVGDEEYEFVRTFTIRAQDLGSLVVIGGLHPETSYRLSLRVQDANQNDLAEVYYLPIDVTDDDLIQVDFPFTVPPYS